MKKVFLFFGIFLACYSTYADIYDVYGLGPIRDTLSAQCLIAQYLLPHINTQFLLKLKKNMIWKRTLITPIQPKNTNYDNYIDKDPEVCRQCKMLIQVADLDHSYSWRSIYMSNKTYFYIKQLMLHILEIHRKCSKGGITFDDYLGTIAYAPGTLFNSVRLFTCDSKARMELHITLDTEKHTWEPSIDLEDYMPGKKIALEQVLFLMLLENFYAKRGSVNFVLLAHEHRENLSKNILHNSMLGIINYLRSILKSFGPLIEQAINEHYNHDYFSCCIV